MGFDECPDVVQTLQKHHHPGVSKAAVLINTPLVHQEEDISEVLETTTYQVGLLEGLATSSQGFIFRFHVQVSCSSQLMEQELKQTVEKNIPLEFERAAHLLQGGGGGGAALRRHFCLTCT